MKQMFLIIILNLGSETTDYFLEINLVFDTLFFYYYLYYI